MPSDGGGSDYEPDEGYKPKKTASRGGGGRGGGSAKKRHRRGYDSFSESEGSSSGELSCSLDFDQVMNFREIKYLLFTIDRPFPDLKQSFSP